MLPRVLSPVVHAELSWLLAQPLGSRRDRLLVTCAGLAPDADGLSLLWGTQAYGHYHHMLTHGLVAAALTAFICTLSAARRGIVALLSFAAFHLHLVCDLVGSGPDWPIQYFWPLSSWEWWWSGAWSFASWPNALIALLATFACLSFAFIRNRTIVELVSPRWDAEVIATLRRRLGRG